MPAALLVIDLQQALCFGEDGAFQAERVIGRINEVASRVRAAGLPVIFVQHGAGGSLAPGGPGWQLAAGVRVTAEDAFIRKESPDAFHRTGLQALLESLGVTSLIICGLQSEFCVDTTTRRALALGYPVQLVSDGHSTVDNGVLRASQITAHHNATLGGISSFGPRVRPLPAALIEV